jgi:hypothetical protein
VIGLEKKMVTKRYPSRDGCFGVTVTPQIVRETDQLRGDIPRSRWVERALRMYNTSVKENDEEAKGVMGSQATNPSPAVTPTPTPEVVTPETNTFLRNGGSGR